MLPVAVIAAARPNFIKVDPFLRELERQGVQAKLVHTGQHYDENMSGVFFRDLEIRPPEVNLEVGSGSHAEQTAAVMLAYERFFLAERPQWTVVVGDVNSTLACALVAAKLGGKVCHIEAGLRSRDWTMPEEINRILTDRLADLLLTTCREAEANLLQEGIPPERIRFVGNLMIDTLQRLLPQAQKTTTLKNFSLNRRSYILATIHRPANVDSDEALENIVEILTESAAQIPLVFPLHPRSKRRLQETGLLGRLEENAKIRLCEPLGYLEFLALSEAARLILTDSGGLQEESTVLGVPCLTLRKNTERPITITEGSNELVGTDKSWVLQAVSRQLNTHLAQRPARIPELWDGHAAERAVKEFLEMACLS